MEATKKPNVELGHHAKPTAGCVVFTRCPSCGNGYHVSMFGGTPTIECPDCGTLKARP